MPKGIPVDDHALHEILWSRTDRLGRLKINQGDLGEEFGLTKFTMSRVITRMVLDERLRHISKRQHNSGYFVIVDPEEWLQSH